ncbi:hypothetical protein [Saccharothrix lopnurensis]|uniref:Uncharacterized protein n=1 Tax=Saccharothrix lopnurensis TaxID=1670621 RepID=A0ABW1PH16_9PSEU
MNTAPDAPLPLLRRRTLLPEVSAEAPWTGIDEVLRVLRDATPPVPTRDTGSWETGRARTIGMIESATDLRLSPTRRLLSFTARSTPATRHGRRHVVHIATATHVPTLADLAHGRADATQAGLDLSDEAFSDYVDALERLPGATGTPIDWGRRPQEVLEQVASWRDPLRGGPDRAEPDPVAGADLAAGARALHTAAMLHALAAAPARDAAAHSVVSLLREILDGPLPWVHGRKPEPFLRPIGTVLGDLNGGRKTGRADQRPTQTRVEDGVSTTVVVDATLTALGGEPHQAVDALRHRAGQLDAIDDWYIPADRAATLRDLALLLAELFSPAPTELQLLRRVQPGDVIAFLTQPAWGPELRVVHVTGPVQYLALGTIGGTERVAIPVNDITTPPVRAGGLLVVNPASDHASPIDLTIVDGRYFPPLTAGHVATDRWAILPSTFAGADHDVVTAELRTQSHRAAREFDTTAHP